MTTNTAIYHHYADIYDEIEWNHVSEDLAIQIIQDLLAGPWSDRNFPKRRVLDLGCGTGNMMLAFCLAGCRVFGIDSSESMLERAREKFDHLRRPATFIHCRMQDLAFESSAPLHEHSFDLITCCFDSLNYLLEDEDLERTCFGVARLLAPGGIFVFDITMPAEFETWKSHQEVLHESDHLLVYEQLHYHADQRCATGEIVWFKSFGEDTTWWRYRETHHERAWSDSEISAALARAGLQIRQRRTPDGEAGSDTSPRLIYSVTRVEHELSAHENGPPA